MAIENMNSSDSLKKYEHNVTSQWGEDGIVAEIFKRIGTRNKYCVDIGAWDGRHFSNVWDLWHNQEWGALLVEGEKERTDILEKSIRQFKNVKVINSFVTISGKNSLESIFKKNNVPKNLDLLCIDIDGDDYYLFESLKNYLPRVLIIEYNPTIPPHIELVQEPGNYFGSSAKSLVSLASKKGYKLVYCTPTNCIFVLNKDFRKMSGVSSSLSDLFCFDHITYLISDYGGQLYGSKNPTYSTAQFEQMDDLINNSVSNSALVKLPIKVDNVSKARIEEIKNRTVTLLQNPMEKMILVKQTITQQNKRIIEDWHKKGKPLPPPDQYKQTVVKAYGKEFDLRTLIETGTYFGDMVKAVIDDFEKIYSIELDNSLYEKAKLKFKASSHVHIIQGDSGSILKGLLKEVNAPTIFWLDGHYSAGVTAKGNLNTPVLAELNAILSDPIKTHVILIDDARCFTGEDDYPTLNQIKRIVLKSKNYNFSVEDDLIRITPKAK